MSKRKNNKKPLEWLAARSKKQRLNIVLLILSNALFSALSVAFAFAVKAIIDGATAGQKNKLATGAVALCAIVLLQFVFRIIINGLTEYIRGKLEVYYKSYVFSQILGKKYEKINSYHSGELLNRLSSDVSIAADGVTSIVPTVVSATVRLVCAVVALVVLDPVFAVAFAGCGALVFVTITFLRGKLKSLHKSAQETDGKVRSFMQESIENILAVKVFSVNDKICERSDKLQNDNFKVKMRRKNYSVTGNAIYNFIFSAGYLFALIYGAAKIYGNADFTYGSLSAILQLVNNVQVPFATLSSVFPKYYAMIASAERLIEIEELENEASGEKRDADALYDEMTAICGENLSFSYGRTPVFRGADFRIEKGEFVVVTGASGIGKSTLVKMLLGVYAPTAGELYIKTSDGKVAADVSARTLFSYVPQGNMLFSGTLRDNVTFVKSDATEEEIAKALEISCSSDFVKELPDGLETVVGENGVGLSEGQIQRIAVARAVLAGAHIMILDEATSALDENTESKVLSELKTLKNVTLIIISHKKAAYGICDKEISVKAGKIAVKELKKPF